MRMRWRGLAIAKSFMASIKELDEEKHLEG